MVTTSIAPRFKHAITFSLRLCRTRLGVPAVARSLRHLSTREGSRWALLVGIAYKHPAKHTPYDTLLQTHQDVAMFKTFLIERFGFNHNNIVVMTDDENTPEHLQPTRANIEREMGQLRRNARPGSSLVFLYSGHGDQVPTEVSEIEPDGLDEAIVPIDGNLLIDNNIHRLLVEGFPLGAKLTMLFDCCHSQSMADLKHNLCNKLVDLWPQVRIFFRVVSHFLLKIKHKEHARGNSAIGLTTILKYTAKFRRQLITRTSKKKPGSTVDQLVQATPICNGRCVRLKSLGQDVTSLSACRDEQFTMEYKSRTLTQAVITLFNDHTSSRQCPTYRQTLRALSTNAEGLVNTIHQWHHTDPHGRTVRPSMCRRDTEQTSSSPGHSRPCSVVFRRAQGWQPQLSSQEPLVMDAPFSLRL
ncbi:hypothetical protein QCA50_011356 [Cerrena zonata]|uniref:Peptidase C14 caspase domain-containing protein n=1 Tax=Cerrena zonata TaxID=2478898 RepID=A0AAW0FZF6_9APHY